jgi:hypothetical protein
VQELLDRLASLGFADLEIESTAQETVVFSMPSGIAGGVRRPT